MTKIGLTQRVEVKKAYEERRDCLDQAWTSVLESLEYDPVPLPNQVTDVRRYIDQLNLDGIILTSGNDLAHLENPNHPAPERDSFEEILLDIALNNHIPVLGVCRGLELINVYFGGKIQQVQGHVATDHTISLDQAELPIKSPSSLLVNSYHDWGISLEDTAENLTIIGIAEDNTVEMLLHPDRSIFGIMWHPERKPSLNEFETRLFRYLFGTPNK